MSLISAQMRSELIATFRKPLLQCILLLVESIRLLCIGSPLWEQHYTTEIFLNLKQNLEVNILSEIGTQVIRRPWRLP